ncbi:MAG TPA: LamG-like jellyroll fold domain-containing protein [Polyangiaceae bacterium]
MTLRPLVAIACVGAAGCSLLLPFDDLTDGARDAGTDGGAVHDATTLDAATDTGRSGEAASESGALDTGTVVVDAGDAGLDAPADAGALYPDGSWCATQPPGMELCDDFDFETPSFERWSSTEIDVQGTADFSDAAESPPHSFELNIPALNPNSFYIEALEKVVPGMAGAADLTISFSFQPAVPWDGAAGTPFILSIAQGPGAPRFALGLDVGTSGINFQEQDTEVDGGTSFSPLQYSSMPVQNGAWTRFVVDLGFATNTATVTIDGVPTLSLDLVGAWSAAASTTVYLGDWFVTTTPGFDVLYDDVVIRRQ